MNLLYTQITENGQTITYYESSDYLPMVLIGVIILAIIFGIVFTLYSEIKKRKRDLVELEKCIDDVPLTEIEARVLSKECFVKSYGIKIPRTCKEFYITFSTFTGEIKRYAVSEELYLSVEENTVGTIAIVNDNFYDFYFKK